MALSEASIIQSNQGFFDAASGAATLPSGTTAGSTVFIVAYTPQEAGSLNLQPPDGFAVGFVTGFQPQELSVWHRQDNPGGETSWTISSPSTLADLIMWFAYEIADEDRVAPLEQNFTPSGGSGVTTQSTGTTASTSWTDLLCVAVHCCNSIQTIGSQTNGFVGMESQQQTSASHGSGSIAVARLYPGVGGTFECTATYGGTVNALAGIVVYRGIGQFLVPPGILAA